MKVQEIMTRDVEILQPGASIMEAAKKMKDLDVGAIPVCDGTKILGLVTDRDIVVKGLAGDKDPQSCLVEDLVDNNPKWIFEDADVEEAAQLMEDAQIRRLIVVSQDKKLVGIVSLGDIATKHDEDTAGDALQGISEPSHPSH